MTPEQKDNILKKADEHGSKNINAGQYPKPFSFNCGGINPLSRVVLTKEKAEFFMMQLEWHRNRANDK